MDPSRLSDVEIFRRCRDGRDDAWREVVRRFSPMVYRLAVRMLRNPDDAADISQEVFLSMHRSLDSYDPTRPLRPWVARVAYNACLHRMRGAMKKATRAVDPVKINGIGDHAVEDPESAAAASERAGYLDEAFAELSSQDRGLLLLRYREGLSDAEVAEATGMAVGTVKTRIFRAKKQMRAVLAPRIGAEES